MTKVFSVVISSLILFQSLNIDWREISKLDELLEHVNMHSKKYGDNILVFISKHYGELKRDHHKDHNEEKNDHEKLPFQHDAQTISLSDFTFSNIDIPLKKDDFLTSKKSGFYYNFTYTSLEGSGIFQPPKHA